VAKIDLKKELKELFSPPSKAPAIVDVPEMQFIMLDGQGDPNTSEDFGDAMGVLYGLSYTLKFMLKEDGHDWVVMPPEGLWWAEDMDVFRVDSRKDEWLWTLMIMQPDVVTSAHFETALNQLRDKKDPPGLEKARFETFHEGPSAHIMHIGPHAEEGPTIEGLHQFIADAGHKLRGKHHEIYLGDPRRTKPERLKTVLRQPIE